MKKLLSTFLLCTSTLFVLTGCHPGSYHDFSQDIYVGEATKTESRTTDLMQLQLSKDQVESGSVQGSSQGYVVGNLAYVSGYQEGSVQGSSESKPVLYVYLRYRSQNGDIEDLLIPRERISLRDDLAPGTKATLELQVKKKKRAATFEDIRKDESLCYKGKDSSRTPQPANSCGKHSYDKPEEWVFESESPSVIHIPKDSVVVSVNPNLVPADAKKG